MIATAFLTDDLDQILNAGLAAVDSRSVIHQVVTDVRTWHWKNPSDWHLTRRFAQEKYSRFKGEIRDRNGCELNTAAVIGALLYGQGDFVQTAITAFNFGWDADNNAATAGTLVGVIKGARWMMAQGWDIKDEYRNTTRDDMPHDETITRFGDRLVAMAERVITEQGGRKTTKAGKTFYLIPAETSANLEKLVDPAQQFASLRAARKAAIEAGIVRGQTGQQKARAAYEAICLDLAPLLRRQYPGPWAAAIEALYGYPKVVSVLFFESPIPAGDKLRQRALAAGLKPPEKPAKIW
jgi:hypothetical protein